MEARFQIAVALALILGVSLVLIPVVMGIVEFLKKLGVKKKAALIASLVLGGLLGGGYYLAAYGVPATGPDWFILVLQIIIPGIAAAGTYDLRRNLVGLANAGNSTGESDSDESRPATS